MENDQTGMRAHDEVRSAMDGINDTIPVSEPENGTPSEGSAIDETKPLRKIRSKPHSTGRYKMFSNHSSANDMPRTSTGA